MDGSTTPIAAATTPTPEIVVTALAGVEMCPALGPRLLLNTAGNLGADAEDSNVNADLGESGGRYVEEEMGYVGIGGRAWEWSDPYLGRDSWLYDIDDNGEYVATFTRPILVRDGLEAIEEQSEVSGLQSQIL